jgi:hypothetical protein
MDMEPQVNMGVHLLERWGTAYSVILILVLQIPGAQVPTPMLLARVVVG